MVVAFVLAISILLQFLAAVLALRLIRVTGRRAAWVLIAMAVLLMTVRRGVTLFRLIFGDLAHPPDLSAELVALATSVLMVMGIARIAPYFLSIKRSEEALKEAQRYTRGLIEASLDPLMTISAEGKITDVNRATELAAGRSRQEIIGTDFANCFTEPEAARKGCHQALQDGYVRDYPLEIEHRGGKVTPALCNASVYHDAQGHEAGVFAAARDITELERAEARIKHLNSVLRAIRNVNQLIVRTRDRDRLLQGACDCLIEARYHSAWIAMLDEAGRLVTTAEAGLGEEFLPIVERLERGELTDCARRALAQAGTLLIEDPSSVCTDCPLSGMYAGREAMIVRLEHGGRVYGLLAVSIPGDVVVDEEERSLFTEVAGDVAFALRSLKVDKERGQAEETLRRYAERLSTLHQIDQAISAGLEPETVYETIVEHAARLLACDVANLYSWDETSRQYLGLASYGADDQSVKGQSFDAAASRLVTEMLETRRPVIVTDSLTDARTVPVWQQRFGIRAALAMPLLIREQITGFLFLLDTHKPHYWHNDEVAIAEALAAQAAIAVENARLYQAVADHAVVLEEQVAARTRELQQSEAKLRAQYKGIPVPTYTWQRAGEDLVLIDYNDAAVAITQGKIADWVGIKASEMYRDAPEIVEELSRCLIEKTIIEREMSYQYMSTGDSKYLAVKYAFVPPDLVLVHTEDITRLKELDRLKDEFVSNVSHELRSPLANIKLYLYLLQRGKSDRQPLYLDTLQRETIRLGGLIEDLLDISRLDQVGAVAMEPVNLEALTADVLTNHLPQAEDRQIELAFDIRPDLPPAWADAAQIVQVLTNLLANALAYTPAGGRVTVSLSAGEWEGRAGLLIAVTDDGPGISPEDLAHIFDRFYRGAVGRESGAPGTGLGLSICKKIVTLHGGRIEVQSKVGQGSTFTVWLPAAE